MQCIACCWWPKRTCLSRRFKRLGAFCFQNKAVLTKDNGFPMKVSSPLPEYCLFFRFELQLKLADCIINQFKLYFSYKSNPIQHMQQTQRIYMRSDPHTRTWARVYCISFLNNLINAIWLNGCCFAAAEFEFNWEQQRGEVTNRQSELFHWLPDWLPDELRFDWIDLSGHSRVPESEIIVFAAAAGRRMEIWIQIL